MPKHLREILRGQWEDLMSPDLLLAAVFVIVCSTFVFWYVEAGNISYEGVVGMYTYRNGPITAQLELLADHTYKEKVQISGTQREVSGSWELFPSDSQNHIAFTTNFIVLPTEQPLSAEGTAYGLVENRFGFRSISLDSDNVGLAFRKKHFTKHS